MYNEQLSQALAVADVINFTAANNTNLNSLGVNMGQGKRLLWVIQNGGLGAAGTIDGRLQSSPNSNFNVTHNIAATNLTQIVGNNLTSTIEVRAEYVQQQNSGDRYVRLQLTTGGNALTGVWATAFLGESEQKPASQYNLNSSYLQQQVVD